ncbi:MAG: HAMP domain-containing histidine kinase [Clostridium sartagoforme]|nr:HAMP domain-containing histidine kinase [Clostridium sartagoforme]
MIWLLLILLIPSVYFSARFFILVKDINNVNNEFEEIHKNIELNRRLKYFSGNKTLEKLLVTLNKYLEEAQREKIKYIRREKSIRNEIEHISHDLRTPLTSMLGYLEFLNNDNIDVNEKKEYLSIIQRRTKGLYNLVQTFYDVSRLEAGEYNFIIENINIDKVIRENILLFYNDFDNKNIHVEVELLDEEVYIKGDKNALERVFTNLFQNAIKYTKEKFNISLKKENNKVVITLANYTDELNEEEVNHIFDRFYMKDNSRSNSSSGLGLTVTKLLIEEMNGEIKVEIQGDILIFTITYEIVNEV